MAELISFVSRIIACASLAVSVIQISAQPPAANQNPRLTIQYGHSNQINDAVFSPDGRLVASAGAEGVAILWDAVSGRELRRFTGDSGSIACVAFSTSGNYLVTGDGGPASDEGGRNTKMDYRVRIWDVASGKQLASLSGHGKAISSVGFSPLDDNVVLTSSIDGTARIWNRKTGGKRIIWKGVNPINAARFSPDGKIIAIAGGDTRLSLNSNAALSRFAIKLISYATGTIIRTLSGHKNAVGGLVFSPDGRFLISTTLLPSSELAVESAETRLWDAGSGRLIENLGAFLGPAAFVAGGAFLAIGCVDDDFDYAICLLERNEKGSYSRSGIVRIGKAAATEDGDLITRDGIVTVVEPAGTRLLYVRGWLSTGGSRGCAAGSPQMFIHDIPTNKSDALAGVSEPFRNRDPGCITRANYFRFANDGVSFLSGSTLWNIASSQVTDLLNLVQKPSGQEPTPDETGESADLPESYFLVSNTARIALVSDSTSVRLVEIASRRTIAELAGIREARFTEDDSLLLTADGEKIYVHETLTGQEVFSTEFTNPSRGEAGDSWAGLTPNNTDIAITPDGKYLFYQSAEKLTRVNIQTRETREFDFPASAYPFLAVSPNSRYVAVKQEFVEFIDVETGAQQSVFKLFSKAPIGERASFAFHALKISPDSQVALIAGYIQPPESIAKPEIPTIKLTEISSGKELWFASEQYSYAFEFSLDNNFFGTVSSDQKTVAIRDRRNYSLVRQITITDALIQQITFAPSSTLILIKTEDGATRIWNTRTGIEICRLLSLRSGNWIVAKTDDGRFDTGDVENINGAYWMMNDRPFEPFPLEVFMRQYYEPGLLQRVLKCIEEANCDKEFKLLPSIAEINRVRPRLAFPPKESVGGLRK